MASQKNQNGQHNTDGEEQSWNTNTTGLEDFPQCYGDQDTGVLAQNRQTDQWYRKGGLEINPYIVNSSLTKEQKQHNGTKIIFSTNVARTLGIQMPKYESRRRPYTFHKN